MDRLEPLDALFVEAEDEDENTSMAIASIAVLKGRHRPRRRSWRWFKAGCHSCPATARSFARCRSASGGRSGSTTRTLISLITSGAPRCRNPAETSNSPR